MDNDEFKKCALCRITDLPCPAFFRGAFATKIRGCQPIIRNTWKLASIKFIFYVVCDAKCLDISDQFVYRGATRQKLNVNLR